MQKSITAKIKQQRTLFKVLFDQKFKILELGYFDDSNPISLKKSLIKAKKFTLRSEMQSNELILIHETYIVLQKCMTRFPLLYYNIIYILLLDALESPKSP